MFTPQTEPEQIATEGKRDGKRHEPEAPAHGRQYDRKSGTGRGTEERKQGFGKGGRGNPKDSKYVRTQETESDRLAREAREKEHNEERERRQAAHMQLLEKTSTLEEYAASHTVGTAVAPAAVEIVKADKLPDDLKNLGCAIKAQREKKGAGKKIIVM